MNINRHNYESFFLLYTDNELDAAGRKAVEEFVQQNPDLGSELALLQQSVCLPDEQVQFAGKSALFQSETPALIHAGNYESFFVLYADDELGNGEKRLVEDFIYHHPQYQAELELLQAVRMAPDTSIGFDDKESLYRRGESDRRIVPFRWWRMAAAALLLLALGLWWISREKPAGTGSMAGSTPKTAAPKAASPSPAGSQQGLPGIAQTAPETPATATAGARRQPENKDTAATPALVGSLVHSARQEQAPELADNRSNSRQPVAPTQPTQPQQVAMTDPQPDRTVDPAILSERPHNPPNSNIRVNARPGLIAQAVHIDRPDDNFVSNAVDEDNDNSNRIAIMNTSVNKNALRGLLRKASRVISKKAGSGDDDDNQRHILIGSFAIAVK